MAAGEHLGVERQAARRGIGCADRVGGAQRKAVHIGAVERRHVDRRRHVVREHAAERIGERNGLGGKRRKIEMLLEARLRLLGRDDFEELLLPRGRAHRIEQARSRWRSRIVHGNARISSCAPAAKAFALGRHQHPAVGARDRLHRPMPGGERLDALRRAAHRHDLGHADRRDDLARECHRHARVDIGGAGQAHAKARHRQRETPPAPHRAVPGASAPAARSRSQAPRSRPATMSEAVDRPPSPACARARVTLLIAAGPHRSRRPRSRHRSARRRSARSSARTKITLAPCAATPRAIASAAASRRADDDAHARLAHHHARDADGLQRGHIDGAKPFAVHAAADDPGAASAPAASTPSPAVAGACTSAPVTASGGSTASASRGSGMPASTHAGRIEQHRRVGPRIRDPFGAYGPPVDQARRRPQATPSPHRRPRPSTRPSASANATSRGATGRASSATRASTSPIGVRLVMRCAPMRHVLGGRRGMVKHAE